MTKPDPTKRSSRCRDCPIGCHIKKGHKKNKISAYAALWGLDQSIQGFDEFIAVYHRRCDDIGLEAFETAAAIALGLKAGYVAGDFNGILEAVEEISRGTELGLILGNGAGSAGLTWSLAPLTGVGPRKDTGRSTAEDIFMDSTGLCSFAYSVLKVDRNIWNALDSLLKAKYGPSFDSEKLKNLIFEIERLENH